MRRFLGWHILRKHPPCRRVLTLFPTYHTAVSSKYILLTSEVNLQDSVLERLMEQTVGLVWVWLAELLALEKNKEAEKSF